jgi:ABC-type Mn2+/Zn2+ transport system permease subunit
MQLILSLISGILIGSVSGYLGSLMLSKKMSVVAGPLAHLAFPGVAIAILLGINLGWGVFPLIIVSALVMWLLDQKTDLPMENLAAIVFAAGLGLSLLFLPIDKAEEALVGRFMQISFGETIFISAISLILFILINHFYDDLMLINVDKDLALTSGIKVEKINLIYLLGVAVVVSLGVYLVGGLITAALVALPAAISKNISSDFKKYKIIALFSGGLGAGLGIILSFLYHLPTGPLVILVNVIFFFLSLIFIKK